MIKDSDLSQIVNPLLDWFANHARELPWRSDPQPYRVWVSEIMLQQTRVEAVKPYFERFMRELPTIHDLAECEEERLLKLWEGLGYYNRVRNMQAAAQTVMNEYDGKLPDDYKLLLGLKGIGHYTAGAIASIAYGKPVPAVDGNVLRVLTRVCLDDSDISKQAFRNSVEEKLSEVIPKDRAGIFNQALMEIGAIVCLPNGAPKCEECPFVRLCRAKKEGAAEKYPVKAKKAERRLEEKTILIIRDGEKIVLRKRKSKGLLAGMYEFPSLEGFAGEKEALKYVEDAGFTPLYIQSAEDAKHIFSHVEWRMKAYVIKVAQIEREPEELLLAETQTVQEKYPIPSAFAAYTKYVNILTGNTAVRELQ